MAGFVWFLTLFLIYPALVASSYVNLDDAELTPMFLKSLGEQFDNTMMQMLGQAFFDIEESLTEKLRNREITKLKGATGKQSIIDQVCEILECSDWSEWSSCSASLRTFGFGLESRNRSCGVNNSLCTYPTMENNVETQSKVCHRNVRNICPPHFTRISSYGKKYCLLYVTRDMSQSYAVDNCKAEGAKLVNIDSQRKADAVTDLIGGSSTTIWINGYRQDVQALWVYTYGHEPDFDNWSSGEPSNGSSELCKVSEGSPRTWWDRSCTSNYFSVCEIALY